VKIVLVRAQCDSGRSCPNINATDRGTLVVQGYVVDVETLSDLHIPAGETVVEVPLSLLPELAADTTARTGLYLTDRDTVLVQGQQVTDQEALGELRLPAGETAVEVPTTRLPALIER